MQTIESICAEFNLDKSTVSTFIDFARGRIMKNAETIQAFQANPDESLKAIFRAYDTMVNQVTKELLENKTEFAQNWRKECFELYA